MKQDNAVVIFCVVALFAVIAWKVSDTVRVAPILPAPPQPDDPPPVVVDGPMMKIAAHAIRAPYYFPPPNVMAVVEATNRGRLSNG